MEALAKTKLFALESTLESIFPHLIKLCAATKKISANKAESTADAIVSNGSYNIYLLRQIFSACDDKNAQPRKAATLWLKTLIGKHRFNKRAFERGEGLALFEKCLKKGLSDSNPDVRKSMRAAYWAFVRLWPERSEGILSTLSEQHRKVLITETADTAPVPGPAKATAIAATKSAAPKAKTSMKDAIATRRQAAKAEKAIPEPAISTSSTSNTRPAAVTNTTRTLSSAPVRPSRFVRKATATSKPMTLDISKSANEVPRATSTSDRPVTPVENKRPASAGPTTPPIIDMAKGLFEKARGALSPKSENPVSPTWRPQTPEKGKQPLSPGTIAMMAKAGWDAFRETEASPPTTPPTVVKRSKAECEALRQTPVDLPEKPILSRKEGVARKPLKELPVNEPVTAKMRDLSKVDVKDMTPKEKWDNVERIHRRASPRIKFQSTDALRKQMRAHVEALKAPCGIDTFHAIQSIIKTNWLVLDEEPEMFDDIIFTIITHLEADDYHTYGAHPTGHDRSTQMLIILNLLLENHCSLISLYFPRLFCATMAAGRNVHYKTHMQTCIHESIKAMVRECAVSDLEDGMDAILDVMETNPSPRLHPQEESLGLHTLKLLMKRSACFCRPYKPEDQEIRLALIGVRATKSKYPEIRHQAVDMLMEYRVFQANDDKFWRNISTIGNDVSRLLTYYYEKELSAQRLETERLLLQRQMDCDVD